MTLLWGLIGLAWFYSPSLCVEGNPCEGTYKFLNESDRSGLIKSDLSKCDGTDLHGKWGWFRVSGDAGNALASNVPRSGTCGTEIRAYLEDAHPSFGVGKLTLTFCTATKSKSCQAKRDLEVINCGEFYLYNLFKFKENCNSKYWRYCTNGIADDKCTGDKCANGKRCVLKDNGNQHECVDAPSSGTQPQMMPPAEDPFSSNPCLNGSSCNNNSDPYTCLFGYSGDNCHINNYEGKILRIKSTAVQESNKIAILRQS
ncbi:Pancreatic secretory granule membrane major glycoprotein GP2 [Stylophora pistillata]|uniref:Pancreatic secretory granule membrane major glycoprotein GP2 n=1 Tax=Stylophora pistillata TaxID=50429 RepID=A0A2B4RQV5_STYPI|nr:Pancreatic secretory granule membrane major glycoprotein GP2 [Stylophora pistillata]